MKVVSNQLKGNKMMSIQKIKELREEIRRERDLNFEACQDAKRNIEHAQARGERDEFHEKQLEFFEGRRSAFARVLMKFADL